MAKPRLMQNVHDMLLSMGVVLGVVALLLGVTYRSHTQVMYPVDYSGTLAAAAERAAFPMVVPDPLPEGLTPTVARYEPETYGPAGSMRLYLGFTTSAGDYISIWQSNGGRSKVVENATNGGTCEPGGTSGTWVRCERERPLARALVSGDGASVIVVSGTAEWKTLEAVRDSLAPLRQ